MTLNPNVRYVHHTDNPTRWHEFRRLAESEAAKRHTNETRIIELSNTATEAHIGYIYGVRKFYIIHSPCMLSGVWGTWTSAKTTASCIRKENSPLSTARPVQQAILKAKEIPSPHAQCKCGINMFKLDNKHIAESTRIARTDYTGRFPVSGLVRGHGKIIEHELGYRVQHAEIIGLYVRNLLDRIKLRRTKRYDTRMTGNSLLFEQWCYKYQKEQLEQIPLEES